MKHKPTLAQHLLWPMSESASCSLTASFIQTTKKQLCQIIKSYLGYLKELDNLKHYNLNILFPRFSSQQFRVPFRTSQFPEHHILYTTGLQSQTLIS
ncbi:hypothetical protein HanIR_Chr17g0884581 [Helianthus annuus]|nr:hypothetical protein HanIR_Chr17g0884581 [Helianthus annuus]